MSHNVDVQTTETLERACADAWPPLAEDKLGDWRLRAANGFTGRANSALAVGDPGMPVGAALRQVCEFAHAYRIEPKAQVLCDSATEAEIAAAGWRPDMGHIAGALVSVQLGPLPPVQATRAEVLATPTRRWWELVAGSARPTDAQRHVLTGGDLRRRVGYCVADVDGTTAGAARGVVVDDLLFLSGLAVRPDIRRRGLATELMGALARWAGDRGATRCVLQVAVGNDAALALYARLGFAESHRYRYWVPGHACEDHTL